VVVGQEGLLLAREGAISDGGEETKVSLPSLLPASVDDALLGQGTFLTVLKDGKIRQSTIAMLGRVLTLCPG
jgi:hypothetical protein